MGYPSKLVSYLWDFQLILLLAILFLCSAVYLSFLWRKRDMFIKSWNMPGPLNLPLIGAAYLFMCRPEFLIPTVLKVQEKFPAGFKMWFGNRLLYSLHEPHHIEKVLGSTRVVQKERLYEKLVDAVGEGLLQAPVVKWKKHRKFIGPSFSQKILDSFVTVFAKHSEIFLEVLEEHVGKNVDIFTLVSRCTLDILGETAMGLDFKNQKTSADHARNMDRIMLLTFIRIYHVWNHSNFIWNILGYEKMLKKCQKKLDALVDQIIQEKLELLRKKKIQKGAMYEEIQATPAFLDYMMECETFSPLELREEVVMFLFAGTDTTGSTLSFLFAMLGMFQDVQHKVYEEVLHVIGPHRAPEPSDLSRMEYTEKVIKETLRLFPVGGIIARAVTEDIDVGDFIIPKGASAFFEVVYIHRNPKYWPDPLKFDPERFSPEEVKKRHPCTYIPFSFGPRNCIGRFYGMMNMKVIIAMIIRKLVIHCEYKKIEDIKLKANLVLRFRDGAKVSVTPREPISSNV